MVRHRLSIHFAKWKRYALDRYGFEVGSGLYTDMNAIRRDEELTISILFMSTNGLGENH